MKNISKEVGIIAIALLIYPGIVSADMGVPMIFFTFPAMLFALIPVILIEAVILSKFLKIKFKKTIGPSSIINLVTTFIGIPLSWFLLLYLGAIGNKAGGCGPGFESVSKSIITVITHSAWLCPWENKLLSWLIPVAAIICLVVAFFVSVLLEYLILRLIFKNFDKRSVAKAVWIANFVSYALLIVMSLPYLKGI